MNFTTQDYGTLEKEDKEIVDKWLRSYHLLDKVVFIEKMDPDEDLTDLKLVAWGISDVDRYIEPGKDPIQVGSDLHQIRVIAEFLYDDFPWEVLNK